MKRSAQEAFGSAIAAPTTQDEILNFPRKNWETTTGRSGIVALLTSNDRKILKNLVNLGMNFQDIVKICSTNRISSALQTISVQREEIKALALEHDKLLKLLCTPTILRRKLARSISVETDDGALSGSDGHASSPQSLLESESVAAGVTPVAEILHVQGWDWNPRIFYGRRSTTPPIAPVKVAPVEDSDFRSFHAEENRSCTPSFEEVDISGDDIKTMMMNNEDPSKKVCFTPDSSEETDTLQAVDSSTLVTDFSERGPLPLLHVEGWSNKRCRRLG